VKFPGSEADLYRLAEYTEERMMQQGPPERRDPSLLRALAAMSEVFKVMPRIVCLIGSTRFHQDFADQNYRLTTEGAIVLSIGYDVADDKKLGLTTQPEVKEGLDVLHMWKIILCDEVLCLNRDGYVGYSTARELGFATVMGKPITYLEPITGSYAMGYDFPEAIQQVMALAAAVGAYREVK
jgi:hypothetical protein